MARTETINSSQNPEQGVQEIPAREPSAAPDIANDTAETEPARLGFVCSDRDWKLFFKRRLLADRRSEPGSNSATPAQVRQLLMSAA